jgi:hypothetical protein
VSLVLPRISRRQTIILVLNAAALLAACIIHALTAYIWTCSHHGHPPPGGMRGFIFLPPVLMFMMNNMRISLFFLVWHVSVLASLSHDCWLIHVGTPLYYDKKGFGETWRQLLLFLSSAVCFGVYLVVKLIQVFISISRDP